ncbi:MAG: aspartate aminotransferase family protein [Candidatus Bathyarchaeia archaeon]
MDLNLSKSRELFEKIEKIVPGGIHSNIRYLSNLQQNIFFSRGSGSRLWDVDGNEYIDCVVNMGALILGHGHPKVSEAVKLQVDTGLVGSLETELSVKVAEELTRMIPCAEALKFSNTGTEAVMKAIFLARAYTGKGKIIKMEGSYHGHYDSVLFSYHPDLKSAGPESNPNPVSESKGLMRGAQENIVIVPYNNAEAAEKAIKKYRGEIAAIVVEPVMFNSGCILPKDGYLNALRDICDENDILLIFDEVITGFRSAPGGAQEYYGVKPDLAIFGKAIANGYPLSAIAGRGDIIELSKPGKGVFYAGTFNGHLISLAAASAVLELTKDGGIQKGLHEKSGELSKRAEEIAAELKMDAKLYGFAGQFQIYFTREDVWDYRSAARSDKEAYGRFQRAMLERGVFLLPSYLFHHGVTAAHTKEDIELILKAMEESMREVKKSCKG